jgi:hypothetical protein
MAKYGALAGAAVAAVGAFCSYEARVLHLHSSPGDGFQVLASFLFLFVFGLWRISVLLFVLDRAHGLPDALCLVLSSKVLLSPPGMQSIGSGSLPFCSLIWS